MQTIAARRAAIYIKEAPGCHPEENSEALQLQHCEEFCKAHNLEIVARYHDTSGIRHDLKVMTGEAAQDEPPFQYIVVYKLRNFSWSLDETVPCRDGLRASGVPLVSTMESPP